MIIVPNFDPNLITIGPIAIRWYSLAYIVGILFSWFLLKYFNKQKPIMKNEDFDDCLFYGVLGIILGGRLGYVLFYNLGFYLQHPLQILAVWQGGMSFHGGLLGAILAMWLFCKKHQINFLQLTDILSVAAPVGLFLGRIANFINLELYGRVTDSKFGMIFPNAGFEPRHPSQLYEAGLEGLLSFIILFSLIKLTKIREKTGTLSGLFLILYGSSRIFVEQFREPDSQIGFIFDYLTLGQLLSLPLIILGIIVIAYQRQRKTK